MELKLDEAKNKVRELLIGLNKVNDDIFNDGYDDHDLDQNIAYSVNVKLINCVEKTLASIDIDGIDPEILDNAWVQFGVGDVYLPENQYNRIINYSNFILNL